MDCLTEQDFQHRLDLLRPVWDKRHVKGRQFYEYFVRQKAPLILSCMGAATRMMAGLGYPPEVYTQNGSECGNLILKHCKNKKNLEIPECVELIRKVVSRQETLEYLAMCGQGEWSLDDKYASKKLEEQKKRAFNKFYVLTISPEDPASSVEFSFISISPEETNILHIPFPKVKNIFAKGNQILNSAESDIHRFGDDTTYVASTSFPHNPHKVLRKGNGKFTCDSSCVNWATYKFCTHTLAVADGYDETVLFVNNAALKAKPDVTSIALLDMPKGRGKNDPSATSPIEQLTGRQAALQQATGQQSASQHDQAPAGQHGGQPDGHHAQQAASCQQSACS